jgi:hypothetical protein
MFDLARRSGESISNDIDLPMHHAKPYKYGSLPSGVSNHVSGVKHRSYWEFIVEKARSAAGEPSQDR